MLIDVNFFPCAVGSLRWLWLGLHLDAGESVSAWLATVALWQGRPRRIGDQAALAAAPRKQKP